MNKNLICKYCSGFLLFTSITLGILAAFIPDKSITFLSILLLNLVLVVVFRIRFSETMIHIARTLLGGVFIFSGFTKGIDPLGNQYQIIDYLEAFGWDWAVPLSLLGAYLLSAFEFMLGIMLLLNIWSKLTAWLTTFVMIFMTFLTLGDALHNTVPDCGCFGKALILSNWQTFYKNLVIDALLLICLFGSGRLKSFFNQKMQYFVAGIVFIVFMGFQVYNVMHLPVIDFMDWKIGKNLFPQKTTPVEHFASYKNIATGEIKEFSVKEIPFSDSNFTNQWEYESSRMIDNNPKSIDVAFLDENLSGIDYSEGLLKNPGGIFIITAYDLKTTNIKGWDKLKDIIAAKHAEGTEIILLTASEQPVIENFKKEMQFDYLDVYIANDTDIKTIVRSNPGLIYIKDGVVVDKWAWRDFPAIKTYTTK